MASTSLHPSAAWRQGREIRLRQTGERAYGVAWRGSLLALLAVVGVMATTALASSTQASASEPARASVEPNDRMLARDATLLERFEEQPAAFDAWSDIAPERLEIAQALPSAALSVARDKAAWLGRYCVQPGCSTPAPAPIANAASFAGVVLVAGWLSRRRGDRRG